MILFESLKNTATHIDHDNNHRRKIIVDYYTMFTN